MTALHQIVAPGAARTIHVIQGGFDASNQPGDVLTTILGSCVATCLCDPVARVGGINHFLLPDGDVGQKGQLRYGLHAMELLINALLKMGARKHRLQGKLFGGAGMHDGLGSIGTANAEFALRFLATEGIGCAGHSLGGNRARRIRYWATTGRAQQLFLPNDALPPPNPVKCPTRIGPADGVTFF